jgi:hypothetical protein
MQNLIIVYPVFLMPHRFNQHQHLVIAGVRIIPSSPPCQQHLLVAMAKSIPCRAPGSGTWYKYALLLGYPVFGAADQSDKVVGLTFGQIVK